MQVRVDLCNSSTQEVEVRVSVLQVHPWYTVSYGQAWATSDPVSKK